VCISDSAPKVGIFLVGAKRKPGQFGLLRLSLGYTPMHEVTPKVVAMAVSTVMMMFRILLQSSLFIVLISDL